MDLFACAPYYRLDDVERVEQALSTRTLPIQLLFLGMTLPALGLLRPTPRKSYRVSIG